MWIGLKQEQTNVVLTNGGHWSPTSSSKHNHSQNCQRWKHLGLWSLCGYQSHGIWINITIFHHRANKKEKIHSACESLGPNDCIIANGCFLVSLCFVLVVLKGRGRRCNTVVSQRKCWQRVKTAHRHVMVSKLTLVFLNTYSHSFFKHPSIHICLCLLPMSETKHESATDISKQTIKKRPTNIKIKPFFKYISLLNWNCCSAFLVNN